MAVRTRVYDKTTDPGLAGFFRTSGNGRSKPRTATRRPDGVEARANDRQQRQPQAPPTNPQQMDPFSLLDLLGGGGSNELSQSISSSYDKQIGAYQDMGGEMGALTDALVGNINDAASSTNEQIGGFFGYAADQANAGRPVIEETHQTAMGNTDAIYDQLAESLGSIPQRSVDQASAAAGGEVGGSVAGRVAASTAPFQAAGETSRANTKANLTQHSAAGQDYLSQLAAAAPSEAAMNQAAVSGRAANAVTEAEMALSQQRAQIAAQTAALEGAKERAIIEHSSDMAGSTFDRIMQTTQLYNALGADTGQLRDSLGLPAAPQSGMGYEDQLDIGLKEQRLADMLASPDPYALGGDSGFEAALGGATASTERVGNALRDYAEQNGLGMEQIHELLGPGEGGSRVNEQMLTVLEEILGGFEAYDPNTLKSAFRAWYQ